MTGFTWALRRHHWAEGVDHPAGRDLLVCGRCETLWPCRAMVRRYHRRSQ